MRFSSCACSSSVAASSAFSIRLSTSKRPRKRPPRDRKSTRLNSSHGYISYAVFCLKKKKKYLSYRDTRDGNQQGLLLVLLHIMRVRVELPAAVLVSLILGCLGSHYDGSPAYAYVE